MKIGLSRVVTLAGALLVAACADIPTPTDLSPNLEIPNLEILDAAHGDEGSHFYFLPPMVPNPGATGVFDATQLAVVKICEGTTSTCAQPIAEFSVDSATITVSVEDEHYMALWHAGDFDLDLDSVYRVSVFVGAQELGYADVQPVSNGKALKNLETGEIIGLVDDRTLPIKVRIEDGAIEAGGITIDATALSALNFIIGGEGTFTTDTVVVLDLAPGTYTVFDGSGGSHDFEVTATGEVSYTAEKEPFFDGLNTSQLTLVGYQIDIDATVLSALKFSVGGVGQFDVGTVAFTFLPGDKLMADGSGGAHAFEVTDAGVVTYAAEKEDFFDGLNTSQLTLVGFAVTIDASVLSALMFSVGGVGQFVPGTVGLTFLPGVKSMADGSGGVHAFEVTDVGEITYTTGKEPFFDGLNTSQLTLVGYEIIIDATALVASTFSLGGIGPLLTASPDTVTMLPGSKSFSSTDITFDYEVEEGGLLNYDTLLDGDLSGRGTSELTVAPTP